MTGDVTDYRSQTEMSSESMKDRQPKAFVLLYCDNQLAICLAEIPLFHARTKHVEVHYHFIREKVLQEEIEMRQINTDDQIADLFTKGLSTCKFEKFRRQLSMEKRMSWC
ncbi:hypothetical protein DVH24_039698 [Malus domestica]|uniref:Uncharacterized protein n=1 Tax=Malus domestica TaxID=3750 RepID=A0A498I700_MALDO|nr:hypothetical protein DVH24_039698 [Malus domestica]